MKFTTMFAATAIALVPAVAMALAPGAKTYVAMAGASDMFEIESSKLVADSSDPKLATFAQMMITDHTKSTNDVITAAKADGMSPLPPQLMPKQVAMIDSLKKVSGTNRDKLYKKQQLMSHKEALALQKSYAASGDMPHLKATASMIVPVVQNHLSEVKSMAGSSASAM